MRTTYYKLIATLGISLCALAPVSALAFWGNTTPPPPTVDITAVTLNDATYGNGSYLRVNPGDPIRVKVTADLKNRAKWKGVNWGINNTGTTDTCTNTKNKHAWMVQTGKLASWFGGDDDDDRYHRRLGFLKHFFDQDHETNNTYAISFIVYAPQDAGLYNAYFRPDSRNNCGSPVGPLFTLSKAILVGNDTNAPVIAPHDDVLVTLTSLSATGATVTYEKPLATDDIDGAVAVSCEPASGSFFPVGSKVVTCMAHDQAGNMAMPVSFNVTVSYPPDLTAPVVAPHGDVSVEAPNANATSTTVTFSVPTATDDRDGSLPVSCEPASGSSFGVGTTSVDCSAMDAAGNIGHSIFTVEVTLPNSGPDTTAPAISAHDDVYATTTGESVEVSYELPTATDNIDGPVAVSCTPASGAAFSLGTTTVTCQASDTAGNMATSSFVVGVTKVESTPAGPYTMASQEEESLLCGDFADSWRYCDETGTWGYTENFGPKYTVELGKGSDLGGGSLKSVTIAKDPANADAFRPWLIVLSCFTDDAYSLACTDWVEPQTAAQNPYLVSVSSFGRADLLTLLNRSDVLVEFATETTDQKYWTADFVNSADRNADGSSPVVFNPDYYYTLTIDDTEFQGAAYGSDTQPYWVVTGIK